ncbi:MAG TPA: tyrosine-type recombinase/integrase [Nonomuraea sp.]|nr:tyrosine-type recombinase/integrase [Nonomuraea sp.]
MGYEPPPPTDLPVLGDRARRLTAEWLQSRASPATVAAYHSDLRAYLRWCGHRLDPPDGHRLDPLRAGRADLDAYAATLADRHAPATVARKLAALSSWYAHLAEHDAIHRNPLTGLKRPTIDRRPPAPRQTPAAGRRRPTANSHRPAVGGGPTAADGRRPAAVCLSRAEAAAFLAAAGADPRPVRLRTAALLGLLLTEGLRVAEVCAADVAHLGYRRGHRTLTVGGRRRHPLAPPIAAALEDYLADRAARAGVPRERLAGPLFVTERSGPHPGGRRMDRWAITKLVRRVARDARIPSAGRLSARSLRRTFATLALDAGAALRDVQEAMGHADPRTTRAYDRTRRGPDRHPAPRLLAYLTER